ncbi:MAG: hypothetical protein RIC55_24365 [Pirellulaceae bacterium]
MAAKFTKVAPGQKFQPSASEWNAMVDAARDRLERRFARPSAPTAYESGQATVVRVRNDTEEELDRFAVVGLDEMLIQHDDNFPAFASQPTFTAVKPQIEQHHQRFAVIQQPLRKGQVGPAVIHSLTVCKVDVQHTADAFCAPVDEQTTSLVSGAGTCRILSKLTSTGEQWAYVQLGAHSPQQWLPFENGSGAAIPAYGLVLLQDPTDGVLKARTYSESGPYRNPFAVNGPVAVANGSHGLCTMDFPAWIAYEAAAAVEFGDTFGFEQGNGKLQCIDTGDADFSTTVGGFRLVGPRRTNPDRGLMVWDQRFLTREIIRFTLSESLTTADSTASATVRFIHGTVGAMGNGSLLVYNQLDDSDESGSTYIFSGSAGDTGLAYADRQGGVTLYYILWVECAETCG